MRETLATCAAVTALTFAALAPAVPAGAETADIETFMQIGYAASPSVSRDGSVVAFESNMSSVTQLYRLDDNGWPYQLTVFTDGIDFHVLSPTGEYAVVGASSGGDEQAQFHLVDMASGSIRALTARPEVRHGSPHFSEDGGTLYYNSNEANGRDFFLYARDLATGETRTILENPGFNFIGDISPDGVWMTVSHYESNADSDILLLNMETGSLRNLTEHEGEVFHAGGAFSPDGRSIWLLTNANEEGTKRMATLDPMAQKPALKFLTAPSDWEVEDFTLSDDRRYLVWLENEEGYTRVHLRDLVEKRDLTAPPVDGIIYSGAGSSNFSISDRGVFYFAFSSATRTTDVWMWDPHAPELRRLTFSTYAGIDPSLFREPELVHVKSFDGLDIPAFIYLPPGYDGGRIPFVMHIHGGPEAQFRPTFIRHFQYLMLNGYGVIAPNVRGSSGYGNEYMAMDNYKKRMDSVKDAGAVARWLIDKAYTSADQLAVKGDSYGGFMTLACLTEFPDLFAAGIDEVGIADFVSFLENTADYRRALREAEYGPLSDPEFLRKVSPLTHVDRIEDPLLVIHGENDPRVPVGEARQIVAALQERGRPVESLIFPDEGHGVAKLGNRLQSYRTQVDFLNRYIKKGA